MHPEIELPNGYGSLFRQFVDDLSILTIFEEEGIDGINQRLEILEQLQNDQLPSEEKEKLMADANRFLFSAIYLFPHLVNSVEIQLDENAASDESIERMNELFYDPGRYAYRHLHSERIKREEGELNTLVLPLPYSTGFSPNGSRIERWLLEDIYFQMREESRSKSLHPTLQVAIDYSMLKNETTFFPSEIRSLRLSPRTDLTPYLARGNQEDPLQDRPDHINHYLRFRGFSDRGNWTFFSHDYKQIVTTEPEPSSNLWVIGGQGRRNILTQGFFAVYSDQSNQTVMYEARNCQLSGYYLDDGVSAKMEEYVMKVDEGKASKLILALHRRPDFTKYTGDKIIPRLVQIPVLPNHF